MCCWFVRTGFGTIGNILVRACRALESKSSEANSQRACYTLLKLDIVDASLNKEFVQPSIAEGHAKKATDKLMSLNLKKAKENFGSQADNMTGILCHISF